MCVSVCVRAPSFSSLVAAAGADGGHSNGGCRSRPFSAARTSAGSNRTAIPLATAHYSHSLAAIRRSTGSTHTHTYTHEQTHTHAQDAGLAPALPVDDVQLALRYRSAAQTDQRQTGRNRGGQPINLQRRKSSGGNFCRCDSLDRLLHQILSRGLPQRTALFQGSCERKNGNA